jgi:hypothetical protein
MVLYNIYDDWFKSIDVRPLLRQAGNCGCKLVRAKSGGGRRLRRWRTDDQQGNLMPRWWGSHSPAGEPFPSVVSFPAIVPPCSVTMASESCSCNNEVSPSPGTQDLQLVLYDWKDGYLVSGDPVIWSFGLWYI